MNTDIIADISARSKHEATHLCANSRVQPSAHPGCYRVDDTHDVDLNNGHCSCGAPQHVGCPHLTAAYYYEMADLAVISLCEKRQCSMHALATTLHSQLQAYQGPELQRDRLRTLLHAALRAASHSPQALAFEIRHLATTQRWEAGDTAQLAWPGATLRATQTHLILISPAGLQAPVAVLNSSGAPTLLPTIDESAQAAALNGRHLPSNQTLEHNT